MTEAGELGCETGRQAKHYWGLAEHVVLFEYRMADEINRALKLFMIGVRGGYHHSLKQIQEMHSLGQATKDDYYMGEIRRSNQRDKAAHSYEAHTNKCRFGFWNKSTFSG